MNNEKPIPYHTLPPEEVLKLLETTMGGLPSSQVQERLERFGYNELAAAPGISPLRIFFRQFKNLLIVILLIATAISFLLGEHLDAWVILGILAACAILGFYQEYTAEQAALALKKMAAPTATVIREGKEAMIPTREVAPGDILALHAGDRVAADGRLLSQFNLMADEAALTGESTPVAKKTNPLTQAEAPLGDRFCMVFGGTMITYGRGLAVVTATGMNSEFGRIARILAEVEEKKTPPGSAHGHHRPGAERHRPGRGRGGFHPGSFPWPQLAGNAHLGHFPGRGRGARSAARGGHGGALHRHHPHGPAQRHRQTAAGGGDHGLHHGDLHRQDRDADQE